MTLSSRDRRALAFLGVSAILSVIYYYFTSDNSQPAVQTSAQAPASQSVDQAERRLARLREIAATVPAKEVVLKTAAAQLATREKGLVIGDTPAQAQAQLLQLIRRLASAEAPPVELRSVEIGPTGVFADAYGSVTVSVQLECRVEQLINLLASVGSQPELVAPSDLRITSSSPKDKTIGVRLTMIALVPRKLIPEKKGGAL